MHNNKIELDIIEDGDVAYLRLPSHPGKGVSGIVCKQILLSSIIDKYNGPEIYLDFDENGVIVGIELLV